MDESAAERLFRHEVIKLLRDVGLPNATGLQAADEAEAPEGISPEQTARRRSWAELIRRVYEVDPLICPKCGGEMRVVAFITDHRSSRRSLTTSRGAPAPAGRRRPHLPQPRSRLADGASAGAAGKVCVRLKD